MQEVLILFLSRDGVGCVEMKCENDLGSRLERDVVKGMVI